MSFGIGITLPDSIVLNAQKVFFGVQGSLFYILNALGFASSGEQTADVPASSYAFDYTGTLVDYGGSVNSESVSVAAVPGSRLATTVADGALLGDTIYTSDFSSDVDGFTPIRTTLSSEDGVFGEDDVIKIYASSEYGTHYTYSLTDKFNGDDATYVSFEYYMPSTNTNVDGIEILAGSGALSETGSPLFAETDSWESVGFTSNSVPIFSRIRPTMSSGGNRVFTGAGIASDDIVYIKNIITTAIFPTIVDTDTSGNDLHPYTLVNGVKDYTFHPAHKTSTLYSAGAKVFAEASDGIKHYYSASAGTTGATAPTFPTSGTVADGGVTWTEQGKYTLSGQRVEASATNSLLQSNSLLDPWTKIGTFSAVQDLVGADGVANTGWTLSGLDIAAAGYMLQIVPGITASRYEPSLVLKQISPIGKIRIKDRDTYLQGDWIIDVSKLGSEWAVVDRNHAAVTVVAEFDTLATTRIILKLLKYSGTGTLSVGYHNSQLELGEISTSQIETTTAAVTRPAVNLAVLTEDTGMTPEEGAARIIVTPSVLTTSKYVFNSRVSGNDEFGLILSATFVQLRARIAGVNTSSVLTIPSIAGEQIVLDMAYSPTDMRVNKFVVGSTPGSPGVALTTNPAQLDATINIGNRLPGTSYFKGTYESVRFFKNTADAANQLDDWSL